MKNKVVSSAWLHKPGTRLSAAGYVSGAFELTDRLERLGKDCQPLAAVTQGYQGGVYRPPIFGMQFARNLVTAPAHGVRFLTGSTMLRVDLSQLPLVRADLAKSPKFAMLQLLPGMTLVSCSGTIGRVAYTRPSMEGIWSSQDIMKIRPDAAKIPPGYLYAFLSSRFGIPLLTAGTYGGVVQHIEREHVIDIPVPRMGSTVEVGAHELVEQAARDLDRHMSLMESATHTLLAAVGVPNVTDEDWHSGLPSRSWVQCGLTSESFRAWNYDPRAQRLWSALACRDHVPLGSVCDPIRFRGKNVFKRLDADPEHGTMLVGQRAAFQMRPEGRWIVSSTASRQGLAVPPGTTMIPSHGTLGEFELYCRAVIVTPRTSKLIFSGDFFRCVPDTSKIRAGYLHAFLRSRTAFRILRSISSGGKQQEQHPAMMWRLPVPRIDHGVEATIADLVDEACVAYDSAMDAEDRARIMVENAIEEAT